MAKKDKSSGHPRNDASRKVIREGPRRPAGRKHRTDDTNESLAAKEQKRTSKDDFPIDPSDLRFTDTHEWIRVKDRSTIVVGVTDFLQMRLTDVTSVELPEPDDHHYEPRDEISVIEALSASAAFHAPVCGTIVATNTDLLSRPELVNSDPYGSGWLVEMRPDKMTDVLHFMDADEYEANLPEDEEE